MKSREKAILEAPACPCDARDCTGRGHEAQATIASLFAFLRVELRLSRSATFWRLSAARPVQLLPEIIEPLRGGGLCLATTAELQPRAQPPLRTVVTLLEPERRSVATAGAPAGPAVALALLPDPVEPSAPTRTLGAVLAPEPPLTQPGRGVPPRPHGESTCP